VISVEQDEAKTNIICQRLIELTTMITNPDIHTWNDDRSGPASTEGTFTILKKGHQRTVKSKVVPLKHVRDLFCIEYKPTAKQVKCKEDYTANLKSDAVKTDRKSESDKRKASKQKHKATKAGVHTKSVPPTPIVDTVLPLSSAFSLTSAIIAPPVEDPQPYEHTLGSGDEEDGDVSSVAEESSEDEAVLQVGMMDGHISVDEPFTSEETSTMSKEVDDLFTTGTGEGDDDEGEVLSTSVAVAGGGETGAEVPLVPLGGVLMPSPSRTAKERSAQSAKTSAFKSVKVTLFSTGDSESQAKDSTPLSKGTRGAKSKRSKGTKGKVPADAADADAAGPSELKTGE
jgi:hypothetical protein